MGGLSVRSFLLRLESFYKKSRNFSSAYILASKRSKFLEQNSVCSLWIKSWSPQGTTVFPRVKILQQVMRIPTIVLSHVLVWEGDRLPRPVCLYLYLVMILTEMGAGWLIDWYSQGNLWMVMSRYVSHYNTMEIWSVWEMEEILG